MTPQTRTRPLRIGMVCPYSFDEPGGVQNHAIELCEKLRQRGHQVSLLGPGTHRNGLPDYVVLGGRSLPIRYNGSVARLSFGPQTLQRTKKWIRENNFDILHLHEPNSPSYSLAALTVAHGPLVATYHASASESRLLQLALPFLRPYLERIHAGIAVSEEARRWQVEMLSGDPVLIPNGVDTSLYRHSKPLDGLIPRAQRVMFLGRFDEPRKGLHILLDAWPLVLRDHPHAELMIAGAGDVAELQHRLDKLQLPHLRGTTGTYPHGARAGTAAGAVRILGKVSDADKAAALRSSTIYVAPNTGGESFGIVLVEAMAAEAAVIASDIPAFAAVGENGTSARLFANEDSTQLAAAINQLLADSETRNQLVASGRDRAARFDWETVATEVERVYDAVAHPGRKVTLT